MGQKAVITINRSQEETERLWRASAYRPRSVDEHDAEVSFTPAPGNRGTEIRVDLPDVAGGGFGEALQKVTGTMSRAKTMDELRRFKQHVETGVMARSDAAPDGESFGRKLKQRPAQPVPERPREKAHV